MPQTVVEGQKSDHPSNPKYNLHRLVDVPYQPQILSVLVPLARDIAVLWCRAWYILQRKKKEFCLVVWFFLFFFLLDKHSPT